MSLVARIRAALRTVAGYWTGEPAVDALGLPVSTSEEVLDWLRNASQPTSPTEDEEAQAGRLAAARTTYGHRLAAARAGRTPRGNLP